jgi:hypothetical protein
MKRICYAVSLMLCISWISVFFIFHAGSGAHTLILLAILFCFQAIILKTPEKIPGEL